MLRSSAGGEVSTATFSRYNDDQWHVVTASKTDDDIRLEIDDYETFQSVEMDALFSFVSSKYR